MKCLCRFLRDASASIHVEYGMIALLIGVGLMVAFASVGGWVGGRYNSLSDAVTSTPSP